MFPMYMPIPPSQFRQVSPRTLVRPLAATPIVSNPPTTSDSSGPKISTSQVTKPDSYENAPSERLLQYVVDRGAKRQRLLKSDAESHAQSIKQLFLLMITRLKAENHELEGLIRELDYGESDNFGVEFLKFGDKRSHEEVSKLIKKVWTGICNNIVPRIHKERLLNDPAKYLLAKRLGEAVSRRKVHSIKTQRDISLRAKKLSKEMLLFWKRHEKEERELRRKAEKEDIEKLKLEEEARERRRQARKLNFLITQTELYGHFVSKKFSAEEQKAIQPPIIDVKAVDFADADEASLEATARKQAQEAFAAQQQHARSFDDSSGSYHKGAQVVINIEQPQMLTCKLKNYQLKGLNWLANLYDQGINGILADDM
jgi:SNF2 family DNA or RNA helicase